jgi:hypothetical protein
VKNVFKQIGAFLFAVLIIGSTTATAMSFHICGGAVTDTAFYKEAEDCGMHHHTPISDLPLLSKKSCCVNDTVNLNSDTSIVLEKQQSIDTFVFITPVNKILAKDLISIKSEKSTSINNHSPPFKDSDLHKIFEVYLI